jgi:hypothetical protein
MEPDGRLQIFKRVLEKEERKKCSGAEMKF